jgi:hypothetical protein
MPREAIARLRLLAADSETNRAPTAISPSPSARPANVGRLGPSVTASFNVKSQVFAEPQVIRIEACGLQRGDMQKYIRTARVVLDETEAAVGIPHFQSACSHRALFPLRLPRGQSLGQPIFEFGPPFVQRAIEEIIPHVQPAPFIRFQLIDIAVFENTSGER